MTLETIVREAYETLGEYSDLQYTDENGALDQTSSGWHRLVDAVNTALLEIASWKFPDGKCLRFRSLEETGILRTKVLSCTIASGSTGSQIVSTNLALEDDDYYAGMVIKYGTETRKVLMSRTLAGATELFLMSTPTVDPSDLAAVVAEREYHFVDNTTVGFGLFADGIGYDPEAGHPLEIIDVYDMTDDSALTPMSRDDPLISRSAELGTPTSYYKLMRSLRFDLWPDEARTYTVRYLRSPRLLGYDDPTLEPELPEMFHRAIVLHVVWWGLRRAQENDSAYATKQDLDYLLRHLKTEYDFQGEFKTHQITLKREV